MNKQIETIRKTRVKILEMVSELNTDQLNKIPPGFNNNIIWNIGHLVASQQGICYLRAGLPLIIEKEFFMSYKPDSKPEGFVGAEEIEKIRSLMFSTLDHLETELKQCSFNNYTNWTTRYGVNITDIEDAVNFLPFHEGLHMGYIMALKRLINDQA